MRRRAYVMLAIFLAMMVGLFVTLSSPSGGFAMFGYVVIAASLVGIILYNVIVYIPPMWVRRVSTTGRQATATVKENNYLKGVGGYQGGDLWLTLPVTVRPSDEPAFDTDMTCKLSQSMIVQAGMQMPVRYDLNNKKKVVLIDSANELVMGRVKK